MKANVTMGLTKEAIEQILGFPVDKVLEAKTVAGSVFMDLVIDAPREEIEPDERFH